MPEVIVTLVIAIAACLVVSTIFFLAFKKKYEKAFKESQIEVLKARYDSEEKANLALAKMEFITNMSHEIRTPMNAITCAVELLENEEMSESAQNFLSILKSSTDSLLDIVNDILDFSKIDSGKVALLEEEYEPRHLVSEIKKLVSVRLNDKPVAFTVTINPTLPQKLIGDEPRIKQILVNLLSNAIKFTSQGEINLSIDYERLSKEAVDVFFAVRDTGCGITEEERGVLFDKFISINDSAKFTEGTGLGLPISKELARLMGGDIKVESEFGKGSTFTAILRQKTEGSELTVSDKQVGRNFALDFAIWEDNLYHAKNIHATLTDIGIPSRFVSNISEAESLVSGSKIDYFLASADHFWDVENLTQRLSPSTVPVCLYDFGRRVNGDIVSLPKPLDLYELQAFLGADRDNKQMVKSGVGKLVLNDTKILLVDDNRVNLKVAKAVLETFKADVTAVDSGYEALAEARTGQLFDCIFMDHMMPGMDGVETAKQLRTIAGYEKVPIVALTANAGGEVETLFFEAGMNDFIPKPINVSHLNYVLEKLIPKSKQTFEESDEVKRKPVERNVEQALFSNKGMAEYWNDERIYIKILAFYSKRSAELMKKITSNPNADSMAKPCEELSKLSKSIGAYTLAEMLSELKNLCRLGNKESIANAAEKIKREYDKLCGEISQYTREHAKSVLDDTLLNDYN